jgi:hypothetical protein
MPFSGMLRRVALVITDVSEGRIASIISVTILITYHYETSIITRATRRHTPEDGIFFK